MKKILIILLIACIIVLLCRGCMFHDRDTGNTTNTENALNGEKEELPNEDSVTDDDTQELSNVDILAMVPVFVEMPYAKVNEGNPYFTKEERTNTIEFETYSELDALGRCGVAFANICVEIMPQEPRGTIGQIRPSGWQIIKYDFIDGKYLYNRCHLIGYQLAGENANEKNLITGTRYLNIDGMLPFENMVYEYVVRTQNHVLYRVTPIYKGEEPLARGVLMEAYSVEDQGEGICFNVFVYNVQPGVVIDYATGESRLEDSEEDSIRGTMPEVTDGEQMYVLNTNSMIFHYPFCESVAEMKEKNKKEVFAEREDILNQGYRSCHRCTP